MTHVPNDEVAGSERDAMKRGGERDRAAGVGSNERRWVVLGLVSLGWFLSLGARLVFPALLPQIRDTFGLDLATAGLLLSLLWFAYAVGQFPGGFLADWVGEGRVLFISLLISAVTIAVVSVAPNLPTLAVAVAAFGFGTAIFSTTRFTICSDLYPEQSGRAMGITGAAGNLGNSVLPFVAGVITAYSTWRYGLGSVVPLLLVAAVGVYVVVPKRTSSAHAPASGISVDTIRSIVSQLNDRSILLVTAIHLVTMFTWQGFTGFFPTYLVEVKAVSPEMSATLFGLFFLFGVVVQPLSGTCGDLFGARKTLVGCFTVVSVSLLSLPSLSGLPRLVAFTAGASCLLGVSPVTMTWLSRSIPEEIKGSGLGLLRTVYIFVASSGPFVVGNLADIGLFDEAFVLLGGVTVFALVLSTFVRGT